MGRMFIYAPPPDQKSETGVRSQESEMGFSDFQIFRFSDVAADQPIVKTLERRNACNLFERHWLPEAILP
jgi:hypothetical protein